MVSPKVKLGIGLAVAAVAVVLIVRNIMSAFTWTVSVEEMIFKRGKKGDYTGQTVYLLGQVVPASIQQKPGTLEYRFEVVPKALRPDEKPALCSEGEGAEPRPCRDLIPEGASISVYHNGVVPDTLWSKDEKTGYGAEVNITGFLREDGVFESQKVLAKCPSKYEEAQPGVSPRPQASR